MPLGRQEQLQEKYHEFGILELQRTAVCRVLCRHGKIGRRPYNKSFQLTMAEYIIMEHSSGINLADSNNGGYCKHTAQVASGGVFWVSTMKYTVQQLL